MFRFGKVRRPRKNNWWTRWAGTSWQGFTFLLTIIPANSKYQQFEVISTFPRLQMQYWNIMKGPWDRWVLTYLSFHATQKIHVWHSLQSQYTNAVSELTRTSRLRSTDRNLMELASTLRISATRSSRWDILQFFSDQCNGEKKLKKKLKTMSGVDAVAPWSTPSSRVTGHNCQEDRAGGSVSCEELSPYFA